MLNILCICCRYFLSDRGINSKFFISLCRFAETARLLEQARCLSQLFREYHDDHQVVKALLAALQQLNRAETADDDLHEV